MHASNSSEKRIPQPWQPGPGARGADPVRGTQSVDGTVRTSAQRESPQGQGWWAITLSKMFGQKVTCFGSCLRCWEIYSVLLVAAFLRLSRLTIVEFNKDQATTFQMARYAATHGLIPATMPTSSLGNYQPPADIDLLMLPAAFSNNPLWGTIMVALLAIASVLLTYCLVRRYYGRVAGTVAALLFATLYEAVLYSRFIWNPSFLPIFVLLFVMALFQGVVARRPGWLCPALLSLGIAFQLHGTAVLLIIPLAAALLLAPGTVRWRDLLLGILVLFIIYLPWLLWEFISHFHDVRVLIQSFLHPQQKAVFSGQAWPLYQKLLSPYDIPVAHWLTWFAKMLIWLVVASMLILAIHVLQPSAGKMQAESVIGWKRVRQYWQALRNSPERSGLLVLLSWQLIPLLFLFHFSFANHLHYFIFLLPGPCILVSVVLAQMGKWLRNSKIGNISYICILILIFLIIIAQGIGSAMGIPGIEHDGSGTIDDDLFSSQHFLVKADQLAQQHHAKHIYILLEGHDIYSNQMRFLVLSARIRTATTILNGACALLPNTVEGPAVVLVGPRTTFPEMLIKQFAKATPLGEAKRLSGPPFRFYLVNHQPPQPITSIRLGEDLALDMAPQTFSSQDASWLVTRWRLLRSAPASYLQDYSYTITMKSHASRQKLTGKCTLTALQADDQILIPFPNTVRNSRIDTANVTLSGIVQETHPVLFHYGPFTFLTYATKTTEKALSLLKHT